MTQHDAKYTVFYSLTLAYERGVILLQTEPLDKGLSDSVTIT